jgi:hypothetical protein
MHTFQITCERTLKESGVKEMVGRHLDDIRWLAILEVVHVDDVVGGVDD